MTLSIVNALEEVIVHVKESAAKGTAKMNLVLLAYDVEVEAFTLV